MTKTNVKSSTRGIKSGMTVKSKDFVTSDNIKEITFDGSSIFGNYNLYEVDEIDFDDSKINILDNFNEKYKNEIVKTLDDNGLKFVSLEYFSPKAYNFSGDSIDLTVKISNKEKLIKFVLKNEKEITKFLKDNVSRDGYISTTADTVSQVVDDIKNKNDIDISVLSVMFKKIRDEYDVESNIFDNVVYDESMED